MNFDNWIKDWENKRIGILGFGKEGLSTYKFFRKLFTDKIFYIADKNKAIEQQHSKIEDVKWLLGDDYLQQIVTCDVIVKSPGIKLHKDFPLEKITSQTNIFFSMFSPQIIGVTGTKGKSTTSSLIYHIIKQQTENVILVGNIGIPPLDKVEEINNSTWIVQELSAHQLQYVNHSPHIALLLNLYPEHLDFFNNQTHYYETKKNIYRFQNKNDIAIINQEETLKGHIPNEIRLHSRLITFSFKSIIHFKADFFDDFKLLGIHNKLNAIAALITTKNIGISDKNIHKGINTFKGLQYRLQFVKTINKIDFYNDSISTIPETTIQALQSLPNVDTLILGGFDRKLNYNKLYSFLEKSFVRNIIFTGESGRRMINEFSGTQQVFYANNMADIICIALEKTHEGKICLLSPAAASYDQYINFEDRGAKFNQEILRL